MTSVGNRLKFHDRSSIVPNQPMINDISIKDSCHMISDICLQWWAITCIVKCTYRVLYRTQMLGVGDCQL